MHIMLKWKKIGENFISVNVGKEYDGEPYYWTTFYYYKGLIIDTGCPIQPMNLQNS